MLVTRLRPVMRIDAVMLSYQPDIIILAKSPLLRLIFMTDTFKWCMGIYKRNETFTITWARLNLNFIYSQIVFVWRQNITSTDGDVSSSDDQM